MKMLFNVNHYKAIAKVFQETYPGGNYASLEQWSTMRDAFADLFAAEYPKFPRAVFVATCLPGDVPPSQRRKDTA